jgi:hypothetical protein
VESCQHVNTVINLWVLQKVGNSLTS